MTLYLAQQTQRICETWRAPGLDYLSQFAVVSRLPAFETTQYCVLWMNNVL